MTTALSDVDPKIVDEAHRLALAAWRAWSGRAPRDLTVVSVGTNERSAERVRTMVELCVEEHWRPGSHRHAMVIDRHIDPETADHAEATLRGPVDAGPQSRCDVHRADATTVVWMRPEAEDRLKHHIERIDPIASLALP